MIDFIDPAVGIPLAIALWIAAGLCWDRDRRGRR